MTPVKRTSPRQGLRGLGNTTSSDQGYNLKVTKPPRGFLPDVPVLEPASVRVLFDLDAECVVVGILVFAHCLADDGASWDRSFVARIDAGLELCTWRDFASPLYRAAYEFLAAAWKDRRSVGRNALTAHLVGQGFPTIAVERRLSRDDELPPSSLQHYVRALKQATAARAVWRILVGGLADLLGGSDPSAVLREVARAAS